MTKIAIEIGEHTLQAELLPDEAPASVEQFKDLFPLETTVKHVRWSGYAVFVEEFGPDAPDMTHLPRENFCVYPSRGDVLLYPGYESAPEVLIACGSTGFRSPAGELAGNHVAVINASKAELAALEVDILENGSRDIAIRER